MPLLGHIVDFYASQARLLGKVDGGYHAGRDGVHPHRPAESFGSNTCFPKACLRLDSAECGNIAYRVAEPEWSEW